MMGASGTAGLAAPPGPERRGARSRTAFSTFVWSSSVVLVVLGLALYLQNRSVPATGRFFDPVLPTVALLLPPMGAFIVSRRPGQPVGLVLCSAALAAAAFLAEQYGVYALMTDPGSLPGAIWAAWAGTWMWVPAYLALWLVLPLLFPDGHPPSPRWRPLLWAAWAAIAVATASAALGPIHLNSPSVTNPVGVTWMAHTSGLSLGISFLGLAPVCTAGLLWRYHRCPRDEQAPINAYVVAATALAAAPLMATAAALAGAPVPLAVYQGVGVGVVVGIAASLAAAIARHGLDGLHVETTTLLVRGAIYTCLGAVALGVYGAVVGILVLLIPGKAGLAPSIVAVAVVAAALHHARPRLRRATDRLLYRKRAYDHDVLVALGECLKSRATPDALLPTMVETIASALRLTGAAVTVSRGGDVVATASWGEASDGALVLPLVHQGEDVGRLAFSPPADGQAFDAADRRLLSDLANQAAVAAYAMRVSADLQRSRERLVSAREEERRRLRRDLHDGLKPALAGVALGLEAAVNLMGDEHSDATALLGRLKCELQAAGSDLRRLVHDLRPPALDELGLVGALSQHANTLNRSAGGPEVVIRAPTSLCPLPAAVEVAAYRIGQEALENVRNHAQAGWCEVAVDVADGELQLEIVDDGAGLSPGRAVGVGLVAMRERASELGGTCAVEPGPEGGTRVRARLPLTT